MKVSKHNNNPNPRVLYISSPVWSDIALWRAAGHVKRWGTISIFANNIWYDWSSIQDHYEDYGPYVGKKKNIDIKFSVHYMFLQSTIIKWVYNYDYIRYKKKTTNEKKCCLSN